MPVLSRLFDLAELRAVEYFHVAKNFRSDLTELGDVVSSGDRETPPEYEQFVVRNTLRDKVERG